MLTKIILPYGYGQTCNQLLQISHWFPVAIERGIPLYFPGFRRYAGLFAGTAGASRMCFPADAPSLTRTEAAWCKVCGAAARAPWPKINRLGLQTCFAMTRAVPGNRCWKVDDTGKDGSTDPKAVMADPAVQSARALWVRGWLYRDHAGVLQHRAAIRQFFSPLPDIADQVAKLAESTHRDGATVVGIHIRRGDLILREGGRYYYEDDVYKRFMHAITDALPGRRIRFLVASNAPINQAAFPGLDVVQTPGTVAGDLYSLATADYLVGPPSTFTIWASYYGNVPMRFLLTHDQPIKLKEFKVAGAHDMYS